MDRRKLLMDILSNFVIFVMLFNLMASMYVLILGQMPWWLLITAVPFFGMLVLRRLIKDAGLFILSHVVILVLPWIFLGTMNEIVLVTIFAVLASINSVTMFFKGERKVRPVTLLILFCFIVIGPWLIDFTADLERFGGIFIEVDVVSARVEVLTVVSAILAAGASILYIQMDNLDFSLLMFRGGKKRRLDETVFPLNNFLAGLFSVITLAVVTIMLFVPGGRFLAFVWRGVGMVLGWVISGIIHLISMIFPDMPAGEQLAIEFEEEWGALEEEDGGLDERYEFEDAPMFAIVAGWILAAVLVLVFVLAAIMIFKAIYEKLNAKHDKDVMELEDEKRSNFRFSFKDLAMFLPRFSGGVKHPVRRAYIRKVNRYIKKGINIQPYHTPEMIADRIAEKEDISELTAEYEVARYNRE